MIRLLDGGVNIDAVNKVRYRPSPHVYTYEGTSHLLSEYNSILRWCNDDIKHAWYNYGNLLIYSMERLH